ncbi:unnamed protein product [Pleuronectes platessa]|uniref:Uncharacterized protein n=1 Tax=Pleuronectes platessa TaxID=8262 RepID=A0A9N7US56_PLEPL|nr:unnamed protein product [Pleuronectes platessa]
MINDENETYPADVGDPEPVCEVSGNITSLAVSRPGTAGDQPTTEQPAARCRCRRRRPASWALIAMRLTPPSLHFTVNQAAAANRKQTPTGPPEGSRRHGSSNPISPNEPELRRGLWHVTYPDRRLCFSARSPLLPGWAATCNTAALLLGQISASHPAHRLISASRGVGGYAM